MTIANQYQVQNQPKEQKQELTLSNLVSNFPFKEIRPKQLEVLRRLPTPSTQDTNTYGTGGSDRFW